MITYFKNLNFTDVLEEIFLHDVEVDDELDVNDKIFESAIKYYDEIGRAHV